MEPHYIPSYHIDYVDRVWLCVRSINETNYMEVKNLRTYKLHSVPILILTFISKKGLPYWGKERVQGIEVFSIHWQIKVDDTQ